MSGKKIVSEGGVPHQRSPGRRIRHPSKVISSFQDVCAHKNHDRALLSGPSTAALASDRALCHPPGRRLHTPAYRALHAPPLSLMPSLPSHRHPRKPGAALKFLGMILGICMDKLPAVRIFYFIFIGWSGRFQVHPKMMPSQFPFPSFRFCVITIIILSIAKPAGESQQALAPAIFVFPKRSLNDKRGRLSDNFLIAHIPIETFLLHRNTAFYAIKGRRARSFWKQSRRLCLFTFLFAFHLSGILTGS